MQLQIQQFADPSLLATRGLHDSHLKGKQQLSPKIVIEIAKENKEISYQFPQSLKIESNSYPFHARTRPACC
jgi:hypothetical protein